MNIPASMLLWQQLESQAVFGIVLVTCGDQLQIGGAVQQLNDPPFRSILICLCITLSGISLDPADSKHWRCSKPGWPSAFNTAVFPHPCPSSLWTGSPLLHFMILVCFGFTYMPLSCYCRTSPLMIVGKWSSYQHGEC